ncbi:hypothetical protein C8Q75DRAFT_284407 [Abortiporus biennis]|nr:hypothetical protein C8Q75DRAFT_284407 [Abortiporus biennis]
MYYTNTYSNPPSTYRSHVPCCALFIPSVSFVVTLMHFPNPTLLPGTPFFFPSLPYILYFPCRVSLMPIGSRTFTFNLEFLFGPWTWLKYIY